MPYQKITLYDNQKVDYLIALNHYIREEDKAKINTTNFVPTWASFDDMRILASFNNNLISSFMSQITDPIVGFSVYRQKIGDSIYHHVKDVDLNTLSIVDHLVSNRKEYKWIIFPNTASGVCVALETDTIRPDWSSWTVTGINKLDNNVYVATEVWKFSSGYNAPVTSQEVQSNLDITHFKTMSKYPKTSVGESNYVTGGFSALLGDINTSTQKYEDNTDKLKAWQEFVAKGQPVLIKDIKGNLYLATIDTTANKYADETYYKPITISPTFTEVGNCSDISVYSTE